MPFNPNVPSTSFGNWIRTGSATYIPPGMTRVGRRDAQIAKLEADLAKANEKNVQKKEKNDVAHAIAHAEIHKCKAERKQRCPSSEKKKQDASKDKKNIVDTETSSIKSEGTKKLSHDAWKQEREVLQMRLSQLKAYSKKPANTTAARAEVEDEEVADYAAFEAREMATKNVAEEVVPKKKVDEAEAAKKKAADEKKAMKKAADEEKAKKAADKEKAKKAADEETAKKAADEEKAKKAADEETAKKAADEEKVKKDADEEKAKKAADEEKVKKAADEEAAKKAADEERAKKAADKEKATKVADEKMAKKKADDEDKVKKKAVDDEEAKKTVADEEEATKKRLTDAIRDLKERKELGVIKTGRYCCDCGQRNHEGGCHESAAANGSNRSVTNNYYILPKAQELANSLIRTPKGTTNAFEGFNAFQEGTVKFTKEQDAKLLFLKKSGKDAREVSRELGMSKIDVVDRWRELSIMKSRKAQDDAFANESDLQEGDEVIGEATDMKVKDGVTTLTFKMYGTATDKDDGGSKCKKQKEISNYKKPTSEDEGDEPANDSSKTDANGNADFPVSRTRSGQPAPYVAVSYASTVPLRGAVRRLYPDDNFSIKDLEILKEIECRYRELQWHEIAAKFYNKTGRMIDPNVIKAKIVGAKEV